MFVGSVLVCLEIKKKKKKEIGIGSELLNIGQHAGVPGQRVAGVGSLPGLEADEAEVGVTIFVYTPSVLAAGLVLRQHVTPDARSPSEHFHDVVSFRREELCGRERMSKTERKEKKKEKKRKKKKKKEKKKKKMLDSTHLLW